MKEYQAGFVALYLLLPTLLLATPETPNGTPPAQSINDKPAASDTNNNNSSDKQALPRGQLLYENHCRKCHESQVHIRENRKAKSFADVQGWVTKWQTEEKLNWKIEDILDVTRYVSGRFYKFNSQ